MTNVWPDGQELGTRLESKGDAAEELVEVQIDEKHLLELIVSPYNISRAIRKVMSKGTYGCVRGR